jgi:phosphoglycolate phosphatase
MRDAAVLFDLDGTVLDTPALIVRVFAAVLTRHGVAFDAEQARRTIGIPLQRAFTQLLPTAEPALIDTCIAEYRATFKQESDACAERLPFPDARPFIESLKRSGVRIAAVTSKIQVSAEDILRTTQLRELFDGVFGHDAVAHGKPAPDLALLAASSLRVAPANALVIGDSTDDLRMARAAGIDAIGVSWGVSTPADFTAHGFPEPATDWADLRSRTARWLSSLHFSEHSYDEQ